MVFFPFYIRFFFSFARCTISSLETIVVYVRAEKCEKLYSLKNRGEKEAAAAKKKYRNKKKQQHWGNSQKKFFQLKTGRLESNITASLTEKKTANGNAI